ncbi:MAG: hypothetical protein RL172_2544 [Bacteroidota bacterium]|jgi:hypothetical protein
MKTISRQIIATIIFIAASFSATAQQVDANINIQNINSTNGTYWMGTTETAFTTVSLNWNIAAATNISNFEVECSFDMNEFVTVGKVAEENSNNDVVKTFSFEHKAAVLAEKQIAQYRLKQTDIYGVVSYSEVKTIGLK